MIDLLRFLPQPMADGYLLEMMPGLTLDQIDRIDVHRVARALQVRRMREVEARRRLYLDDKIKADSLSADEWKIIAYHDKLLGVGEK